MKTKIEKQKYPVFKFYSIKWNGTKSTKKLKLKQAN